MNQDEYNCIVANQERIMNQNAEIIWANVFHDTIKGSTWLAPDFPFSPGRGAIGYPALYALYRILNERKPKSILECGLGQSTKLFGEYIKKHSDAKHRVVEHDENWIEFFSQNYNMPEEMNIVHCDIVDAKLEFNGSDTNCTVYIDFEKKLSDRKYDLIFIDGPYGFRSPLVSRIDIIPLLPACLEDEFVILLDDMDRNGEMMCFKLMLNKLDEAGIKYASSLLYKGEKLTGMITSRNLSFLCTM